MSTPSSERFDPNNSWNGLTLTDTAAEQIKHLVANDTKNMVGIRLSTRQSGCAGYAYELTSVYEIDHDELVYEHLGAKVYVSMKDMPYLDGTEIDFVTQGLNQIFQFNNPKAQNACGCGESFSI